MKGAESAVARSTLRDDGIVVARAINLACPRTRDSTAATLDLLAGLIEVKPRPVLWDQRAAPLLGPSVWIELIKRIEHLAVALAILNDDETTREHGGVPTCHRYPAPTDPRVFHWSWRSTG
jgi:hypothetical protein